MEDFCSPLMSTVVQVNVADLKAVDNMMDVNFWSISIIYACMQVYPIMTQQGSGHIVNVSSFAGLMPGGLMSGYSASKYAAVGFTLDLRS